MTLRVAVVLGRGVPLDSPGLEWAAPMDVASLRALCLDVGDRLGVTVTVDAVDDGEVASVVGGAVRDGGQVVVTPGASTAVDALAGVLEHAASPPVLALPGDMRDPLADHPVTARLPPAVKVIAGRGADVWLAAIRHVAYTAGSPAEPIRYGSDPAQVADLRLPEGSGRHPVVVLLHGGYWWPAWERDTLDGFAVALPRRGVATWNVEYRRVGRGGGWPATARDVAAAVDHLARIAPDARLDLDRVTVFGHSAGAPLAVWAVSRPGPVADPTPGSDLRVRPARIVTTAGALDFDTVAGTRFGRRALAAFFDDRDPVASPSGLAPLGVRCHVAHVADDDVVPVEASRRFVASARSAGDDVSYDEPGSGGHATLVDPATQEGAGVLDVLAGGPAGGAGVS